MSDQDFNRLSTFIYEACGIKLPPAKKTMLSSRLQKRLRQLELTSYSAYIDYVLSAEGQARELIDLIDAVSTNKTDFFREAKHFEVLAGTVLPYYAQRMTHSIQKTLRVWSAGCSSGEEPYTLLMVLDNFFSRYPGLNFTVLATDICTEVLAKAEEAVYADAAVAQVSPVMRNKYLMKGKGAYKGFHRVVPELRRKVEFRRLNFMDRDFCIEYKMDIIFCRNVVIYFDRKTQQLLFEKFYRQFSPEGHLFIGHSETLEGIGDRMERIAAAVYRCRR